MRINPCRVFVLAAIAFFGMGIDRRHTLKWLFSQEKATLHGPQKVYVYSENALASLMTGPRVGYEKPTLPKQKKLPRGSSIE
jgi:hypothetical protein